MFEETIIQSIIDAWVADQVHPGRDREQKPSPTHQDIRTILETTYLASLRHEEGRPIAFSITLFTKDSVDKELSRGRKQIIMTFKESLPFAVDALTKIAPAFNSFTSSLLVAPKSGSTSEYEIWGVMFHGPDTNIFNEIPYGDDLLLSRPDVFTMTVVFPGSILISRRDGLIGRFVDGEFVRATPEPFYSKAMGQYIINLIQSHQGFVDFNNRYWHFYRETLLYLLNASSAYHHGGTIIIVPRIKIKEYGEFIQAKYILEEKLDLATLLSRILKEEKGHALDIGRINTKKKFAERLDFLVQLTCVDGALVITDDLNVLSFGSTLRGPKWDGNTIIGPDGFGGGRDILDVSKLGTRHNSAINFLGACPYSIAFVISQDGQARGFIRIDEKTILCWLDCLSSMFIHR